GAVAALPPQLIPDLLSRLGAAGPGPSPVVRAVPSGRDPASLLEGGAFDVLLVRGAVAAPGIGTRVVAREPVGVALPVTHALANRTSIAAADLNGVPLISFGRSTDPAEFDRVYTTLASAGLTDLRLGHESHPGAVDASLRMVASGAGASLKLMSEITAFASPTVVWRPLEGVDLDVVVSAAWRYDRMTPSLRRLLGLFG
ncbi:MAG TPA: LysR family substrate-binding domain-containing protein, partial [Acidimicrobiales bacterium]